MANQLVNGHQHTVCWHVDDLKSSHVDAEVNTSFLKWLNRKYGEIAEVKATHGKRHDYLAMFLDYGKKGAVVVDMCYYVEKMVLEFPYEVKHKQSPWTERLFKVDSSFWAVDIQPCFLGVGTR